MTSVGNGSIRAASVIKRIGRLNVEKNGSVTLNTIRPALLAIQTCRIFQYCHPLEDKLDFGSDLLLRHMGPGAGTIWTQVFVCQMS